jgi:hypothetical protein
MVNTTKDPVSSDNKPLAPGCVVRYGENDLHSLECWMDWAGRCSGDINIPILDYSTNSVLFSHNKEQTRTAATRSLFATTPNTDALDLCCSG